MGRRAHNRRRPTRRIPEIRAHAELGGEGDVRAPLQRAETALTGNGETHVAERRRLKRPAPLIPEIVAVCEAQ